MAAFDLYEHDSKPNLFRKKMTLDLPDGEGKTEHIDIVLYADFRKTVTGQFYADPGVAHEDVPLIQELKDAIAKLPENGGTGQDDPGTTTPKPSNSTAVGKKAKRSAPAVRPAAGTKTTGMDVVIPAIGVTMRELNFTSDIDYYISKDGYQLTVTKEGVTKLAAYASQLQPPVLISDSYEEIEYVRDATGQLRLLRLKGMAWLGPKDAPLRTITDEIDWDWNSAMTRAIIKNVKNGEYLRWQAENKKHGTPFKDKKAIENAFAPDEITYTADGTLAPKPDAPMSKIIPLMSYMADVREFALRTCIGKMRSRMWSELLGMRTLSAQEIAVFSDDVEDED